jgi:hypothetical protein
MPEWHKTTDSGASNYSEEIYHSTSVISLVAINRLLVREMRRPDIKIVFPKLANSSGKQ